VSFTLISSDVPKAVPADPTKPATSTLNVTNLPGKVASTPQVSVNVSGAPICSLALSLQHPDGTVIPLLQVGLVPTTFQCSPAFTSLNTTFPTRTPTPGSPDLATLNGKVAQGNWVLVATDARTAPDEQRFTINAWMLGLTAQE
jgi:hypothetical protein